MSGAHVAAKSAQGAAAVDAARLRGASNEPDVWMAPGRTYDEQRFSPLKQIDASNVSRLGLAWFYDLDSVRGNEATPVMVDGVLYTIAPWNITTALDAKSGKVLWSFDPKVNRAKGRQACCDVVSRGVAIWNGKVILATLDGRVIALDSLTGRELWSFDTFAGRGNYPLVITGAPRVFDGRVVIGNGGADMGSRGFVTALDADTGALLWRWYIVPGDPSQALREQRPRDGREDMDRRHLLESRWRRQRLGQLRLRPGSRAHLCGYWQRGSVAAIPTQSGRGR